MSLPEYLTGLISILDKPNNDVDKINQSANEMLDRPILQMAGAEGVTESMNATDKVERIRRIKSIQTRVEEVILNSLVYA